MITCKKKYVCVKICNFLILFCYKQQMFTLFSIFIGKNINKWYYITIKMSSLLFTGNKKRGDESILYRLEIIYPKFQIFHCSNLVLIPMNFQCWGNIHFLCYIATRLLCLLFRPQDRWDFWKNVLLILNLNSKSLLNFARIHENLSDCDIVFCVGWKSAGYFVSVPAPTLKLAWDPNPV